MTAKHSFALICRDAIQAYLLLSMSLSFLLYLRRRFTAEDILFGNVCPCVCARDDTLKVCAHNILQNY